MVFEGIIEETKPQAPWNNPFSRKSSVVTLNLRNEDSVVSKGIKNFVACFRDSPALQHSGVISHIPAIDDGRSSCQQPLSPDSSTLSMIWPSSVPPSSDHNLRTLKVVKPSDKSSFQRLYEQMMLTKSDQGIQTNSVELLGFDVTVDHDGRRLSPVPILINEFGHLLQLNVSAAVKVLNAPKMLPKCSCTPPVGAAESLCVFIALVTESLTIRSRTSPSASGYSFLIPACNVQEMRHYCYKLARCLDKLRRKRAKALTLFTKKVGKSVAKMMTYLDNEDFPESDLQSSSSGLRNNSICLLPASCKSSTELIDSHSLDDQVLCFRDPYELIETEMEIRLQKKDSEAMLICRMYQDNVQPLANLDMSIQIKILLTLMEFADAKFRSCNSFLVRAISDFSAAETKLAEIKQVIRQQQKLKDGLNRGFGPQLGRFVASIFKKLKSIEESTRLSRFCITNAAQRLKLVFGHNSTLNLSRDFTFKPHIVDLSVTINCNFLIPAIGMYTDDILTIMKSHSVSTYEFTPSDVQIEHPSRKAFKTAKLSAEKIQMQNEATSFKLMTFKKVMKAVAPLKHRRSLQNRLTLRQLMEELASKILKPVDTVFCRMLAPSASKIELPSIPFVIGLSLIMTHMLVLLQPSGPLPKTQIQIFTADVKRLRHLITLEPKHSILGTLDKLSMTVKKIQLICQKLITNWNNQDLGGDSNVPSAPATKSDLWELRWSADKQCVCIKVHKNDPEILFRDLSFHLRCQFLSKLTQTLKDILMFARTELRMGGKNAKKLLQELQDAFTTHSDGDSVKPNLDLDYHHQRHCSLELSRHLLQLSRMSSVILELDRIMTILLRYLDYQKLLDNNRALLKSNNAMVDPTSVVNSLCFNEPSAGALFNFPLSIEVPLKFSKVSTSTQLYTPGTWFLFLMKSFGFISFVNLTTWFPRLVG